MIKFLDLSGIVPPDIQSKKGEFLGIHDGETLSDNWAKVSNSKIYIMFWFTKNSPTHIIAFVHFKCGPLKTIRKLHVISLLQSKHNPSEIALQCWKSSNNDGQLEFYHVSLLDGRLGVVSWVVFILADLAYKSYTSCHLDGKPAGGGHLWQIRIGHPHGRPGLS